MNRVRLRQAEQNFFWRYPGGFNDPEMLPVMKKHKIEKMKEKARTLFAESAFENQTEVLESIIKTVSQSSLVSVFEKPRFRDLMRGIPPQESVQFTEGLRAFLHGDQEAGFREMISLLSFYKLAKWPLLTVLGLYYHPDKEVLVKPTTVKNVIRFYELEGLEYSPKASWEFYRDYRSSFMELKSIVSEGLKVDNAAFSGFLMIGMENPELSGSS